MQRVHIALVVFLVGLIGGMLVLVLHLTAGTSKTSMSVITVLAKQYTYVPDVINIKYGEWVKLRLTTADVAHSFTLPTSYGINEIISPGKETDIILHATKKGVFAFFCDIYCGPGDGNMTGEVLVQ